MSFSHCKSCSIPEIFSAIFAFTPIDFVRETKKYELHLYKTPDTKKKSPNTIAELLISLTKALIKLIMARDGNNMKRLDFLAI